MLSDRLRTVSLLMIGALTLHWLRYLLAFGPDTGAALERHGHAYLDHAGPALVSFAVTLIAARLALPLIFLAGSARGSRSPLDGSLRYGAALLCVFASQELAEGYLAAGHPAGLDAILANHGWLAFPLALMLGGLVSRLANVLDHAERLALVRAHKRRRRPRMAESSLAWFHGSSSISTIRGLAFGFARRPPPTGAGA